MIADSLSLKDRIKRKLADATVLLRSSRSLTHDQIKQIEERSRRFCEAADHIMRGVIRPRMEVLASQFDNATLNNTEELLGQQCVCSFERTAHYPGKTKLTIGVGHDVEVENLLVFSDLAIQPVYIPFDHHDEIALPLTDADDERLSDWVERAIERFVETYLRLERAEQLRQGNLVVDPVCGMTINKSVAVAQQEFQGKTYYFCVKGCLRTFTEHPKQYVTKSAT